MASKAYSTRFHLVSGLTGTQSYTVPAGKRAVVKQCDANYSGSGTGEIWVGVNGVPCVVLYSAGVTNPPRWSGMLVAYAGEQVQVAGGNANWSYHVSGYLLDDP